MTSIELLNLPREFQQIKKEMLARLLPLMENGSFVGGKEIETFERQFADMCGARYAVGVASGTAALHLSLVALGIGPGDEVLTSAVSFNATAEAIAYTGATPVFVDVCPQNGSIDPVAVARAITRRTKALIPVHLYGIPAEMNALRTIARTHHLLLIEDCAQAHGSQWKGRHVGTFGEVGCFSFMAAKNVGAYGDAGAIVTNRFNIARKLRMLRDHGRSEKYRHAILGFAERLDNLQAAVLNVKLPHLREWNQKRAQIVEHYHQHLDPQRVQFLSLPSGAVSSNYVFPILVQRRSVLQHQLLKEGIKTGIYYPIPLHRQPVFKPLGYTRGSLPQAEAFCQRILALPLNPFLRPSEIQRVIQAVNLYAHPRTS